MTADRDSLADLISDAIGGQEDQASEAADAVIAAGWRPVGCPHEAWELDGRRRTCADCGERLSDTLRGGRWYRS